MKNFLFVIATGLILFSCTNSKSDFVEIDITSAFEQADDDLFVKDYIDSLKYVFLETNESALIGEITKLVATEEFIIILNDNSDQLFVFSITGKHIKTINAKGNGPSEYLIITDFHFDPQEKKIFVLDSGHKRVISYEVFSANTREYPIPLRFWKFTRLESNQWAFLAMFPNEQWPDFLFITDSEFNEECTLTKSFSFDIKKTWGLKNSEIFSDQGGLVFWNRYGDTLFHFQPKSNSNCLVQTKKEVVSIKSSPLDRDKKILEYNSFVEYYLTDNYLIFFANKKRNPHFIFYNRTTGSSSVSNLFRTKGMINNLDNGPNFFPDGMANQNVMYNVIAPDKLIQSINTDKKQYGTEIMKKMKSVKASDNPIIQIAYYK